MCVYPLMVITTGWLVGMLAAHVANVHIPASVAWIWLSALPGLCMLQWFRRKHTFCVALAMSAAVVAVVIAKPARPIRAPPPGPAQIVAHVERVEYRHDSTRTIVRIIRGRPLFGGEAIAPGARIAVFDQVLTPGTVAEMWLTLSPWVRFSNPTPHPDWRLAPSRSPQAAAHVIADTAIRRHATSALAAMLHRVRTTLRDRLRQYSRPRHAAMAQAWLLGESHALSPNVQARIRSAGLAHVLAVSGLHVALFAGVVVLLLKRVLLWCTPMASRWDVAKLAYLAGIACALGYAAMAGGAASAWRAAGTATAIWSALLLDRKPKSTLASCAAVLAFSVAEPSRTLSPAFLMSICATAALLSAITTGQPLWRRHLSVTVRPWLATAPLVIWIFGGAPLVALASNAALLPLVSAITLPLCFLHGACSMLCAPLAPYTGAVFGISADAFVAACQVLERVDWGEQLPPASLLQGVVLGAAAIFLLARQRWQARIAIALSACLGLCVAEVWLRSAEQPSNRLRVTFLDVGQGDAALVDLPDGRLMAIDVGGNTRGGPDPGERVIAPLLAARRRSHIDVLVISHPHPDHYQGLSALLGKVSIGEIWDSGQAGAENPRGAYARLLAHARSLGSRILTPKSLCRNPRHFAGAEVVVLWPCPEFDAAYDVNDNSLVVSVGYGRQRFLFTGDIEAAAERALLSNRRSIRASVLKVAHHGSATSSSESFLAAVGAKYALISSGMYNRFGHPHRQVLDRLGRHGMHTIMTQAGGILAVTDGKELRWSR